jgi:hypothetical protein
LNKQKLIDSENANQQFKMIEQYKNDICQKEDIIKNLENNKNQIEE